MKSDNRILIYDDYCPLCTWYTGLFVRYNLIHENGRLPFSQTDPSILSLLDIERSKNEIPLIDVGSKKTWYGIDALVEIIGQKLPFLKTVTNIQLVKWLLLRVYRLVSYNRKVIVAKKCSGGKFDCSPHFNFFYRMLFMFLFFFFNTAMLFVIHRDVLNGLSFYHLTNVQLQSAHFALVFINCSLAITLKQKRAIEYLGQVNMLALITVLLLVPLILLSKIITYNEWIIVVYLLLLTIFILKEYFRRMHYINITKEYKNFTIINLFCLAAFIAYLFV